MELKFKKGDFVSPKFEVYRAGNYKDKEILDVNPRFHRYTIRNLRNDFVEELNADYIEEYYELKPGLKKFTKLKGLYEL